MDPITSPHLDPVPPEHRVIEVAQVDNRDPEIIENKDNESKEKPTTEGEKITVKEPSSDTEKKFIEDVNDEKKDIEKPLLDEDSVTIELSKDDEKLPGEDTPTLPMPDKKKKLPDEEDATGTEEEEEPPSMYLSPLATMRYAWKNSSGILDFLVRAVCIIFGSLGWLFCVGGVPLLPLVMLIIGSIYLGECPIEPRIPVYLVVAGVFGTIQHGITVWTKYAPKDKKGIIEEQRKRCMCIEGLMQIFLTIWFIAGCVWVYRIYEPEYKNKESEDYCNKTVYLFTFWMFNIAFIILASIIAIGICCILCVVLAIETVT